MPTINQDLRDLILKRSHMIYMFENGMIKDMVDPFNRAKTEMMSKIAKLEDYGQGWTLQYRMDRLNSQLREIDTVLKYANDEGIGIVSNYLNEFGQTEKEFYDNLLADKFGTIGIGINKLPIEQIHEIVNTPIGGLKYHERMIKRYDDSMFDIKSNLTQSIIQGEDMAKASRRLLGQGKEIGGIVGNRLMQQSQTIARTEIMRVSNSVAERIYNQNTDILKGNQWLSTLDHRTCISCGALDGKIFYFNKGMVPPPRPLHPNCRCTLVPITKSWAELGADQKIQEPDASTRPFTYTGDKPLPGSRQYLGQKDKWAGDILDTEFYPQWLKRMDGQDPAFVKGILGSKRYDLWQSGKIEFKEMVKNNRILRLDELGGKIKSKLTKSPLGTGKVTSVSYLKVLGGVNQSRMIEIKDINGVKFQTIFKPIKGETWKVGNEKLRESIINKDFSYAQREVLAYKIDQSLGFNMVPETRLRRIIIDSESKLGSIQTWIEDKDIISFADFTSKTKNILKEDTYKLGIFDFLIGNTDRHGFNILVNKKTRKIVNIDHGCSFPSSYEDLVAFKKRQELGLQEFKCSPLKKYYKDVYKENQSFNSFFNKDEREKIIKSLNDLDIEDMAKKYKMSDSEKSTFLNRRKVLVDAIRENKLDDLLKWSL